jgi:hypothetical protein
VESSSNVKGNHTNGRRDSTCIISLLENRIIIFSDLYYNVVISYWNLHSKSRDGIDILINENVLNIDNKLFTKGEQDYFDYHLNKTKFSNSLDLRNSYLHGTQTDGDELRGLKFMTPNQRHTGQGDQILENRQQVYEAAKAKHPDRWSGNTRNWTLEDEVWLNPEKVAVIQSGEKLIY